jgi:ketosteroid isomerase-like protein
MGINDRGSVEVASIEEFDRVLGRWPAAVDEFQKGNPLPTQELFSHRHDVTLANPLGPAALGIGPVAHGWEQVSETQEHAASQFRDGEPVSVELVEKHVSPEFAYVVHIERAKVKIGGREEFAPLALRATMIFRPEDGEWKIVHRHADPITTPQPAESVIQE